MKTYAIIAILCLTTFSAIGVQAQYEEDVASVESITKAYYDIISGPIGQKRNFDRLRNLFHPNCAFTYSYWSAT